MADVSKINGYNVKDSAARADILTKQKNIYQQDSAPSNPQDGDLWIDTSINTIKRYNGTSWDGVGGGSGGAITSQVTVLTSDWNDNVCIKNVVGVTSSNIVIISPDHNSYIDYANAQIRATAQSSDSLTFTCTTVPTSSITINIVILG